MDPVLNLCVTNCGGYVDPNSTSDARKPVKLSPNGRIDAAVATLMAVSDMGTETVDKGAAAYISNYGEEGFASW